MPRPLPQPLTLAAHFPSACASASVPERRAREARASGSVPVTAAHRAPLCAWTHRDPRARPCVAGAPAVHLSAAASCASPATSARDTVRPSSAGAGDTGASPAVLPALGESKSIPCRPACRHGDTSSPVRVGSDVPGIPAARAALESGAGTARTPRLSRGAATPVRCPCPPWPGAPPAPAPVSRVPDVVPRSGPYLRCRAECR